MQSIREKGASTRPQINMNEIGKNEEEEGKNSVAFLSFSILVSESLRILIYSF